MDSRSDQSPTTVPAVNHGERPEYEVCISDSHAARKGLAWCGKHVGLGFAFEDVDHAAQNGRGGGHLIVCRDCLTAAVAALRNGWECAENHD